MMKRFVGSHMHKKFSLLVLLNERSEASRPVRVEHERAAMRSFLRAVAAEDADRGGEGYEKGRTLGKRQRPHP